MTLPPQNLKFHRLDLFAYQSKLVSAMTAMKQAYHINLLNLWMETYSNLVVLAFSPSSLVSWRLRNRWSNCLTLIRDMNFFISYLYRR